MAFGKKQPGQPDVLFNDKEVQIIQYLLDTGAKQEGYDSYKDFLATEFGSKEERIEAKAAVKNGMVGKLQDFAPLMPTKDIYKAPNKHNNGEQKAYRWAQNSTRKLMRLHILARIDKGTYHLRQPNKASRILRETLEWITKQNKVFTAAEVDAQLKESGDYPSGAAVARKVGIDRRRWSRLVAGTTPTEEEQELINACAF